MNWVNSCLCCEDSTINIDMVIIIIITVVVTDSSTVRTNTDTGMLAVAVDNVFCVDTC